MPCVFAQATKSFTVLCGLSAATARMSGIETTVEMGLKSFSTSYGSFFISEAVALGPLLPKTRV